jgi:hypothetical protein
MSCNAMNRSIALRHQRTWLDHWRYRQLKENLMNRKTACALVALATSALGPAIGPALAQSTQLPAETSTTIAKVADDQGETVLRTLFSEIQQGNIDANGIEPMPRVAIQQKLDGIRQRMQDLGEIKSVSFAGRQNGGNVYDVRFAEGSSTWVLWLTPNGKIAHVRWAFN